MITAKYGLNQQKQYAVFCNGITKVYDSQTVINHINLKIQQGHIFGLLGPNGAGKLQ